MPAPYLVEVGRGFGGACSKTNTPQDTGHTNSMGPVIEKKESKIHIKKATGK
jgi:hypothetical protein